MPPVSTRTPAEKLLSKHSLRKTRIREAVIDVFLQHKHALSHADLETHVGKEFDRVTIYRTLHTFEEQGLVHKILDESGAAKYALCTHDHSHLHKHYDKHVHFCCSRCNYTYCLDEVPIPLVELPSGYRLEKIDFLVQGVCRACLAAEQTK